MAGHEMKERKTLKIFLLLMLLPVLLYLSAGRGDEVLTSLLVGAMAAVMLAAIWAF